MDSASDSEKRNGEVHEDGTPERKGDRDLWVCMEGGRTNAWVTRWDKDTQALREKE